MAEDMSLAKDYRRPVHKATVLDEVMGPDFIVENKKLLQALVDGAKLGQSATQLFAYQIFLWRMPLIITTTKWDYSHLDAVDKDWIEANRVPVHISEPVWDETPQPKPASPRESGRRPVLDVRVGPSPEHKVRKSSA